MELNANFDERAVVHGSRESWVPSPMKGVDRRMLDRLGDEVARATSIVRYAPGSKFSAHTHTGGEEFLVLEGVFQDEHGDFPAGTYVRNPPTSSHTPGSESGCTIFVKLWQFDMADRHQMAVDTNKVDWEHDHKRPGVQVLKLYEDDHEQVSMERWEPNTSFGLSASHGLEVLVTQGSFEECGEGFETQSWLRLPGDDVTQVTSGPDGCTLWIKRNHMKEPPAPPVL